MPYDRCVTENVYYLISKVIIVVTLTAKIQKKNGERNMNKKSLVTMLASLGLVAVIGVGATFAYFTDTDDIKNIIKTGHVAVKLTETDGTEITDEGMEFDDVLPGQVLDKDPTITVEDNSADCYIRLKYEVVSEDESISSTALQGVQPNIDTTVWKYNSADGYYYYQEVCSAKDSIKFFTTVTIPEGWGNNEADGTFNIVIKGDAVQADAVTRDANGFWSATVEEYNGTETYTN